MLGDLPKGLAPVRGRPFLDMLLEYLARQGLEKVVFCVSHLRNALIERYSNWPGIQTSFSVETEPLGTGGAVKRALSIVSTERFYVLNGDSFCDVNLVSLLQFHLKHGAQATLTVSRLTDRGDVGQVRLDASGKVMSFAEKSSVQQPENALMNAGIYILERSAFDDVREVRLSLEHELIPRWTAGGRCYGYVTAAEVVDIGTPDRYARAQDRL